MVKGKTYFVMKPNRRLVPELHGRLCADVVVDCKMIIAMLNQRDADAALLSYIANYNRTWSRGRNIEALNIDIYEHLPLCRRKRNRGADDSDSGQGF